MESTDQRDDRMQGLADASSPTQTACERAGPREQIAELRAGGQPEAALDLRGASLVDEDMAGLDLSGACLREADLSHANLRGVRLVGADLTGARLYSADLRGSILDGADLSQCSMVDVTAQWASLEGTCARGADLTGADLTGARLVETDLRQARLTRTTLREGELVGARLKGACLEGADLRRTHLRRLEGFKQASWLGVDLRESDFTGSYLCRSFIHEQNFIDEFRRQGPLARSLYWVWWISSDCGRSAARWAACTLILVIIFAWLYTLVEVDWGPHPDAISPVYFSVVTMSTLGYGDIFPVSVAAKVVAMFEAVTGYLMLGGLLTIFASKMAGKGE